MIFAMDTSGIRRSGRLTTKAATARRVWRESDRESGV